MRLGGGNAGFSCGHKLEVPIGQSHGGSKLQLGVGWHSGGYKEKFGSLLGRKQEPCLPAFTKINSREFKA